MLLTKQGIKTVVQDFVSKEVGWGLVYDVGAISIIFRLEVYWVVVN